ncbi:MAG: hypothetical protein H0V29_09240 [Thermoleophilaceae bacterium]|nr:hypothetical protein [Thermoleophilaceae bacterium]
MPAFVDKLRKRAGDAAERTASGSAVPAGADPSAPAEQERKPSVRERGLMRRRLRVLRQKREAMLADLGALVYEQHRQERPDADLVRRKTGEVRAVDEEARALDAALGHGQGLDEVMATGIAGSCARCQSLIGTEEKYCSRCGTSRDWRPEPEAPAAPAPGAQAVPAAEAQTAVIPTAESQTPPEGEPDDEAKGNGKTPREEDRPPDEAEQGNGQAVQREDE